MVTGPVKGVGVADLHGVIGDVELAHVCLLNYGILDRNALHSVAGQERHQGLGDLVDQPGAGRVEDILLGDEVRQALHQVVGAEQDLDSFVLRAELDVRSGFMSGKTSTATTNTLRFRCRLTVSLTVRGPCHGSAGASRTR